MPVTIPVPISGWWTPTTVTAPTLTPEQLLLALAVTICLVLLGSAALVLALIWWRFGYSTARDVAVVLASAVAWAIRHNVHGRLYAMYETWREEQAAEDPDPDPETETETDH